MGKFEIEGYAKRKVRCDMKNHHVTNVLQQLNHTCGMSLMETLHGSKTR